MKKKTAIAFINNGGRSDINNLVRETVIESIKTSPINIIKRWTLNRRLQFLKTVLNLAEEKNANIPIGSSYWCVSKDNEYISKLVEKSVRRTLEYNR